MALDTRDKRGSAVGVNSVSPILPNPDGTVDAGDRAQLAQAHRGEQAENPPPVGWRIVRAGSPRAGVRSVGIRASIRARA